MNRRWWVSSLITMVVATVACDGGTPAPTTPSSSPSFLTGTWTGTLTIEREGEVTTAGPTSWTFDVVTGTNLQTFRVTIQSQHPWLPISTTVTSAITPSNTPPARISTQGDYASPRGCTGSLLSVGTVDAFPNLKVIRGTVDSNSSVPGQHRGRGTPTQRVG
jgi:hypothetical protein